MSHRLALAVLLLAPTLVPAVASAEPKSTKCYAGSQTVTIGKVVRKYDMVLERTLDPGASTIEERAWSTKDPGKERHMTGKVDLKTSTFTFSDEERQLSGTAKLEGKPWKWTAQSMEVVKDGVKITTTSKLDGEKVHMTGNGAMNDKEVFTLAGEFERFDCAKLAEKTKAISAPPADKAPAKP